MPGINKLPLIFDEAYLCNEYTAIVAKIAPIQRAIAHKSLYLRRIGAE